MGIDPSLRNSGVACLNWNSETNEIWVTNCAVLRTPAKIKGLDAIYYMINEIKKFCERPGIMDCDHAIIEFPAAFYNPKFSAGTMSPLSGIAGAAYTLLNDFEDNPKAELVYPTVWNKRKNKQKTSQIITQLVGEVADWHFDEPVKNPKLFEHVIDAVGMCYYVLERDLL